MSNIFALSSVVTFYQTKHSNLDLLMYICTMVCISKNGYPEFVHYFFLEYRIISALNEAQELNI